MLDSLLNATSLPLLEQQTKFNERRQEVLAGNIANIDTPHYARRDLDEVAFHDALVKAVESRQTTPASRYGGPPPMIGDHFSAELFDATDPAVPNLTFHDGAERSIESEITQLTRNSLMQSFAVQLMAAQMNTLQSVIAESP